MNCQHVCKYIFPEAIFNTQCYPDTQQRYALILNSSPLFKIMNMQTRFNSGNTKTGILVFRISKYSMINSRKSLEDSTHGHHQMVNTKIRLIIFFVAKDGEALYSQQKQDQELTVAQIMNSILPKKVCVYIYI